MIGRSEASDVLSACMYQNAHAILILAWWGNSTDRELWPCATRQRGTAGHKEF
jgi:hypothetical protein